MLLEHTPGLTYYIFNAPDFEVVGVATFSLNIYGIVQIAILVLRFALYILLS